MSNQSCYINCRTPCSSTHVFIYFFSNWQFFRVFSLIGMFRVKGFSPVSPSLVYKFIFLHLLLSVTSQEAYTGNEMTILSKINFMSCNFLSDFYNHLGVQFSFIIHYMTSNFVKKKSCRQSSGIRLGPICCWPGAQRPASFMRFRDVFYVMHNKQAASIINHHHCSIHIVNSEYIERKIKRACHNSATEGLHLEFSL